MKYPDMFVLRHGQTVWNQQGKFQGRKDTPLTDKGKNQALRQKELLATLPDVPSKTFCSPIGRAVQTAILALGSPVDLTLDVRLQEIDFGAWEGATVADIRTEIDYPFESGLWNFRSPGGEDYNTIRARVSSFLQELEEPALIVTHGITSIVLRGLYLELSQMDVLKLPREQGCIYQLSNGSESVVS